MAVSYTHLDVYKRQIITLSEETDFINVSDYKKYYYKDENVFPFKIEEYYGNENSLNAKTIICLLYTSRCV